MASRAAASRVPVTWTRRCPEEVRGGLELSWCGHVALALQAACERAAGAFEDAATSSSSSSPPPPSSLTPPLAVTVTGHTTPAVFDIGRGSIRVTFNEGSNAWPSAPSPSLPVGGLLVGIRRHPHERWVPALAAAPGGKGPDRYGRSRDGLAELVVMARPLDGLSRDARDRETALGLDRSSPPSRSEMGRTCLVTCLDDAALRAWMPAGHAAAQVVVLRKMTDFHLGLNANRWLKIRMKDIADGAARWVASEASSEHLRASSGHASSREERRVQGGGVDGGERREDGWMRAERETIARLLMDTGLEPDPDRVVSSRPPDAAHLFEHWGAGGNTGVSGQVTGYEADFVAGVKHPAPARR